MATPDFPRVKSLKLRNFKGIAELDLEFDESLTLLAGTNGAGKTSILQALLAAVTRTWWQTPPNNYPRFEFSEGNYNLDYALAGLSGSRFPRGRLAWPIWTTS